MQQEIFGQIVQNDLTTVFAYERIAGHDHLAIAEVAAKRLGLALRKLRWA